MLTDSRLREMLGGDARVVHFDCSVDEIPAVRPVARLIKDLFERGPAGRMAFGKFFLTDATATTLFGMRPCGCHRSGTLRTGADLLHVASLPDVNHDAEELDLDILQGAVDRFRQHRALRQAVAAGADPGALRRFEGALPDYPQWAFPCKLLDIGARASTLTIGQLFASGGNAAGLARTLDPTTSTSPALREFLAGALADAALREDAYHEAAGPHLGLTYLLLAREEIVPAVARACRERGCDPADLPLHALPVPLAARERAAGMACTARGILVPEGGSALEALRRSLT